MEVIARFFAPGAHPQFCRLPMLIHCILLALFPQFHHTQKYTSSKSNMEMRARVCDLLGKRPNRQARVVTFSHRRIKKVQEVNLQWKRFFSEKLNRNVRLRLSTKGIKTVNKMGGIDEAAKKFELDLAKF